MFLIFADGLNHNISTFIEGMQEQLGHTLPIIGAGSCDDFHIAKTFQYFQKNWMNQGVAGVIFGGRLVMGASCKHGWKPLGKPRTMNQSESNVITSIDGQKASKIYQEYLGDILQPLQNQALGQIQARYPLGVYTEEFNQYILRYISRASPEGNLTCQDNLPTGSRIHVMIGNKDFCLQAAEEAALEVKEQLNGRKPQLVLILESFIRHKMFGKAASQEIQVIKNILGPVPIFGMYSRNEIFSQTNSLMKTSTHVNNGSIIILAIS